MSERAFLTAVLWFFTSIVLGALFISATAQGALTMGHVSLALVILSLVVIGSIALSRWKDGTTELEKSKRQALDNILRDMSDDELIRLKERLATGNLDDEKLLEYMGSDGELVGRS